MPEKQCFFKIFAISAQFLQDEMIKMILSYGKFAEKSNYAIHFDIKWIFE